MKSLIFILLISILFSQFSCAQKKKKSTPEIEYVFSYLANELYIENLNYDKIENPDFGIFTFTKGNSEFQKEYSKYKCIMEIKLFLGDQLKLTIGIFKAGNNYEAFSCDKTTDNSFCNETVEKFDNKFKLNLENSIYFKTIKSMNIDNPLIFKTKFKLNGNMNFKDYMITQEKFELKIFNQENYRMNSSYFYFILPIDFLSIDKSFEIPFLKDDIGSNFYFSISLNKDQFSVLETNYHKNINLKYAGNSLYPIDYEIGPPNEMRDNAPPMSLLEKNYVYSDSGMHMIQINDLLYFFDYYGSISFNVLKHSHGSIELKYKKINGEIINHTLKYQDDSN